MQPVERLEAVAMHYVRQLWAQGYFDIAHTDCGGAWISDEPACRDNDTHFQVTQWLIARGLISVQWLPTEAMKERNIHPRDWYDMWWLELTTEGRRCMAETREGETAPLPSGTAGRKLQQ